MPNTQNNLTPEEITTVASLLAKLQPGFLPYDIFMQFARIAVCCVVEVVPLRLMDGRLQVLLLERPATDPYFPNKLHTPGTIVRATDQEGVYADAFQRLLHGELKDVAVAGPPEYVTSVLHKSKRGMEDATVFFVEVTDQPTVGTFYNVDELPDTLIDTQVGFIRAAALTFQSHRLNAKERLLDFGGVA